MLTNATTRAGRALLALLLRVDIGRMAGIKIPEPDAGLIMQWLTALVTNFELAAAWLVIWPVLHVATILIGRFVFGASHGSPPILIVVEVFPAFMLGLAMLRLVLSFTQFAHVSRAVGQARKTGASPPAWSQRPGVLLRLANPSDADFLVDVALIALIEFLVK